MNKTYARDYTNRILCNAKHQKSQIVELVLDYIVDFDFRGTALAVPYVLFYYVGLWGLIGYAFRFDRKWGFLTLVTYFLNMSLSVLQHFV